MLKSVKTYVYDRRGGLAKTTGVVAGAYLVGRYVVERLEEVKEKVMEDRIARDNLRRRFQQNQEDVSYTIMALMPTIGEQILKEMDVEGVTNELQSKSKASKAASALRSRSISPSPIAPSQSSLASSAELLHEGDARSDAGSTSVSSHSGANDSSNLGESSTSWVDNFSAEGSERHPSFVGEARPALDFAGAHLSDSITTASSALSYGNEDSVASEELSSQSSSASTKSKSELWNEVKILTLTRTLTILYSTTLLSLFTTLQLTLLARAKYVQSILQLERDERTREQLEASLSISALLMGGADLMSALDLEARPRDEEDITEDVEVKYLTLSWWLLHVGWKDIGERVRRGVEEVFDSVSLKSKLGVLDFHRLVSDVRRRVEHEFTFEGTERRINFLSALLPPTPETLQHVLTQGGISSPNHSDPAFSALLGTTHSFLASSDFQLVLEVCLDRATGVLFDGLERNVFVDSTGEGASGPDVLLRLAGMLPGLARWSRLALHGLPNELVENIVGTREVTALSAIVFAGFEDRFR
ncbi:hypothetical protein PLICRDRAFT_173744 [Plicaturopsis crispa FD-325 SS-3]|nr:hypothetical protein PLICRDRAFT_173744 [Plicaturopsis crispa FD-325 SS-3]